MTMKKVYSIKCNKYIKFEIPKILNTFDKSYFFPLFVTTVAVMMNKYLRRRIGWDVKNSWFKL